jgi:hypothetical protein
MQDQWNRELEILLFQPGPVSTDFGHSPDNAIHVTGQQVGQDQGNVVAFGIAQ